MSKKYAFKEEKSDFVVGLDIGTTKIAMVIGSKNDEGKIDIHGYGRGDSLGVQHGLVYNLLKTVSGINEAKKIAQSCFCQDIHEVFVGVAGRHIRSLDYVHTTTRINGKDNVISQQEVNAILETLGNISAPAGEQILDVIPQRFKVDGRWTDDPVGELGEIVEGYFQIILGNKAEVNKILRCVKETDLHAEGVILEPIASGLACLSFEEKKSGVVLVDIGGGTSDVAIFMNGEPVFTRVIPIGGQAITKDIATFFNIPEETAETLKKNHGTCVVSKSKTNQFFSIPRPAGLQHIQIGASALAEVIHARLNEDILKEVKTAIEQSGYDGRINSGLVLTGGGSSLRDIRELFQYTLNLPVRIGLPCVGFVKNLPSELQFPMYSTVLGLLKYGIEGLDEIEQFEKTKKDSVKEKKKKQEKEKSHGLWDAFLNFAGNVLEKTP